MVTVNLDVLTPEQRAKVIKNDPSLASKYAISAPAKSTESTSSTGKYTLEQLSKDINSGAVKTQADVDKNVSTRGYSGNTVADKAPTGEPTKTFNDAVETALPGAESRSTLVEFADALDKATTLARQGRQAKELGILDSAGFQPGKVNASTMGQILNLLDQRSGNRTETLQTAAMDAYKMEEERKATEKTNIQNLALQMLTKGVDQTTIQGILNTTSLDQAMLAAAGALKATGDYDDIVTKEVNGETKFYGVKMDGTVEELASFGSVAEGGSEYKTFTENGVIYQYPVDPKTGKAMGPAQAIEGQPAPDPQPYSGEEAVTFANELIRLNPDKGYDELYLGIKANTDVSDAEAQAILEGAGIIKDEQTFSDDTLKAIAIGYVKSLGFEEAKNLIKTGTISVNGKSVKLSKKQIDSLTAIIDKEYPEGKRTWVQSILPGGK